MGLHRARIAWGIANGQPGWGGAFVAISAASAGGSLTAPPVAVHVAVAAHVLFRIHRAQANVGRAVCSGYRARRIERLARRNRAVRALATGYRIVVAAGNAGAAVEGTGRIRVASLDATARPGTATTSSCATCASRCIAARLTSSCATCASRCIAARLTSTGIQSSTGAAWIIGIRSTSNLRQREGSKHEKSKRHCRVSHR
jgi:hypothetical protein